MYRIKRYFTYPKRDKSLKKVEFKNQLAYFRKSIKKNQPLMVRLHDWSSDYRKIDQISIIAAKHDVNYIHPNFQGPNNHPNACGSDKVIEDIDNAIDYAIQNGNVDDSKIYVFGVSGGGHATLCHFMKSTKHKINTYMAWVPITDLEDWYYESLGRKNHYHKDILAVTRSKGKLNVDEAKRRSPYHMETPKEKLLDTKLKLYTGIHDGYTGEVPITHTLKFYNKLAREHNEALISSDDILYLLEKRRGRSIDRNIGGKDVHYYSKFGNVEVTVFEGGHTIVGGYAIKELLEKTTKNVV